MRLNLSSNEGEGQTAISYPVHAIVTYQFPARGSLPPVKLMWHEGGEKPGKPALLESNRELSKIGQLIIGRKGTIYDGNDYCTIPPFIPQSFHKQLAESGQFPPKKYSRPDPLGNPRKEWTKAIRESNPAIAGPNFEYSSPFTEMVSLGTVAIRVGKKFTWDSAALRTNLPEADALLQPNYRRGWIPREIA